MSAISFSPSGVRGGSRDLLVSKIERWALPAILTVAGLNFFLQLGSSSYFTDEVFSVVHSLPGFGEMFHVIARTETTPWAYFLFMHLWLHLTGSQAEWVTRLPSAIAGIGLVAATFWMARAFVGRRTALAAAALTAISPLVESYAQEARVYVFLMLAVVVSVGATVRAEQRPERRNRLLVVGALAAFVGIWLHYTALSVVVPLAVWVATRRSLTARQRVAFIAVCVAAVGSVLPILLEQYRYTPNGGQIKGAINWNNVISVIGTPFGTRVGTPVDPRTIVSALVVAAAALVLLARKRLAERALLVALGVFGLVALIAIDVAGQHILITRYTTITAPFLILAIAAACAQLPRPAAAVLAIPAVLISLWGVYHDHRPAGFYAPARPAIAYIAARELPGDFMISPGPALTDVPIFYYVTRRTHPKLHFLPLGAPAQPDIFATHKRVWIVDWPRVGTDAAALAKVAGVLHRNGFHAASVKVFTSSITLGVVLAVPNA